MFNNVKSNRKQDFERSFSPLRFDITLSSYPYPASKQLPPSFTVTSLHTKRVLCILNSLPLPLSAKHTPIFSPLQLLRKEVKAHHYNSRLEEQTLSNDESPPSISKQHHISRHLASSPPSRSVPYSRKSDTNDLSILATQERKKQSAKCAAIVITMTRNSSVDDAVGRALEVCLVLDVKAGI